MEYSRLMMGGKALDIFVIGGGGTQAEQEEKPKVVR